MDLFHWYFSRFPVSGQLDIFFDRSYSLLMFLVDSLRDTIFAVIGYMLFFGDVSDFHQVFLRLVILKINLSLQRVCV
jgi:hypothetical protein